MSFFDKLNQILQEQKIDFKNPLGNKDNIAAYHIESMKAYGEHISNLKKESNEEIANHQKRVNALLKDVQKKQMEKADPNLREYMEFQELVKRIRYILNILWGWRVRIIIINKIFCRP